MVKKVTAILTAAAILLSLTACNGDSGGKTPNPLSDISAADESAFEYEYDSEYGGMIITDYLKESPKVNIPDTLEDEPVVGVNLSKCEKELTHIYFPDSVIRISLSDKTEQTVKYLGLPAAGADYDVKSKYFGEYFAPTIDEFYQEAIDSEYGAYTGFKNLEYISVTEKCPRLTTVDGMLFYDYNGEKILLVCPQGKSGSINLPKGTTKIGDYAFYNCTKITSITIPDSVTEIGRNGSCESLTSITYKGKTYNSSNAEEIPEELSGLFTKTRAISADSTANRIRDIIDTFLLEADAYGYGMRSNSRYVDRLEITVDSTGKWTVSGINPDHFSDKHITWDSTATATLGEEKSADMNPAKLFALHLADNFPELKYASIYAVLVGGKYCTFVAYTTDTDESIADDVAADNLVATNGDPNKNSAWDSLYEGVGSKNGYIIGTSPKIPMA